MYLRWFDIEMMNIFKIFNSMDIFPFPDKNRILVRQNLFWRPSYI